MKHIKVFETTSALNTWKAAHSGVNPYAYFCIETGITYYQPFINANGHAYVDLGLPSGTLWATMNLGAQSISDPGSYFAWGETSTKSNYSWETYDFGTENNLTKYNTSDGKTKLDLEDDAAHVIWGGDWHIPTKAQWDELLFYINTWDYGDTIVMYFDNDNSLTFVTTGYYSGSSLSPSYGKEYQTANIAENNNNYQYGDFCAWDDYGEGWTYPSWCDRCCGTVIRPVIGTLDVFNHPEAIF